MDNITSTALDVITSGQLDNPADTFLATQQSRTGRDAQRSSLKIIAEFAGFSDYRAVPWQEFKYEQVLAIQAMLLDPENYRGDKTALRPGLLVQRNFKTVNKMIVALRGVLKQCWQSGKMTSDQYRRAASVASLKGESMPAGKARSEDEIGRIIDTCENDLIGIRDQALLAIMYVCGLRRAEIVGLDVDDYDPNAGSLLVRGKGNRERLVYVADPGALELLDAWLKIRREAAQADEELERATGIRRGLYMDHGPLFYKTNGHRAIYPDRMAATTLHFMVTRRGKMADLPDLTCHDMRRSYATNLLDAGADVLTVSKLMGHQSLDTTRVYDRRPEAAKKAASGLVHIRHNPQKEN